MTAAAAKGINAPVTFPNQITVTMFNVANAAAACPLMTTTNSRVSQLVTLVILLGSVTEPTDVVAPGTYVQGDRLHAILLFNDGACDTSDGPSATSGTVGVDSVTGTSVDGRFDLTFPVGQLTGTFSAPLCGEEEGGSAEATGCVVYPACSAAESAGSATCLR
jgi:hypothetical protein